MDPKTHWQNLSWAICLGGHVRVGWEDNPYIDGELTDSNARLGEKIVRIANDLGREILLHQMKLVKFLTSRRNNQLQQHNYI